MRLINGKDYYDSMQAWGAEPGVVLTRDRRPDLPADDVPVPRPGLPHLNFTRIADGRPASVSARTGLPPRSTHIFRPSAAIQLAHVHAVVAGVLYCGVEIDTLHNEQDMYRRVRHAWTLEQFQGELARHDVKVTEVPPRHAGDLRPDDLRPDLKGYFEPTRLGCRALDFLVANKIAVMTTTDRRTSRDVWSVNTSNLVDIGFQRRLDPWTAFQEIAMFVSGVLTGPEAPTVEPDDATRKHEKGFDEKSFRRRPRS